MKAFTPAGIAARTLLAFALLAAVACPRAMHTGSSLGTTSAALAASTPAPAGHIPDALPAELMIGLGDVQPGAAWMRGSGVRWHARYRYLTKGWLDNWGYGQPDGSFARKYMDESAAAKTLPVLTWYGLLGEPGGGEGTSYAKLQNANVMRSYFGAFRVLMQRAKEFAGPVLVHLEPDAWALIEQQSGHNPNAPAVIASSGLPELQGLPNTVAGWGQAFLMIRERMGATNVILAPHISAWATGTDLNYGSGVTADLSTHVDRARTFLNALGLARYDLIAMEWLDRDCRYHELVNGQKRCWSTSDGAALNTMSFNRNLEWMRLWNRTTGKRILLWQLPHGISTSPNVAGRGWVSNHVEYVFGAGGAQHRERLGSAGVIGLLFGSGAVGQATHLTATLPDGGSYIRDRVLEFGRAAPQTCVTPPPVCVQPPPACTGGSDGGLELPR